MSQPATPPRRKRPWYVLTALIAALMLGFGAASEGCLIIGYYQLDVVDLEARFDGAPESILRDEAPLSEEMRARRRASSENLILTFDAARQRFLPLGIASLLIGMAMALMASRALWGRPASRAAIIQLSVAHIALAVLGYLLLPDVRRAEVAYLHTLERESPGASAEDRARAERLKETRLSAGPVLQVAGRSLVCALVILALTRRAARDLLDRSPQAV